MKNDPSHTASEMKRDTRPAPAAPLTDPRTSPDFLPQLFPSANGSTSWPVSDDEKNDRIVMDFLAAYYQINRGWARLRELRARPPEADFATLERSALESIETALRIRDELEDHYAPVGVVAEAVIDGGITTDVHFTFGSTRATGQFRSQPIVFSVDLKFRTPNPAGRRMIHPPGPPLANATILPAP